MSELADQLQHWLDDSGPFLIGNSEQRNKMFRDAITGLQQLSSSQARVAELEKIEKAARAFEAIPAVRAAVDILHTSPCNLEACPNAGAIAMTAPKANDAELRTGQSVAMLYAVKFGPLQRDAFDYLANLAAQACASMRKLTEEMTRHAALDEAAKLCDDEREMRLARMNSGDPWGDTIAQGHKSVTAGKLAEAIRALAEAAP